MAETRTLASEIRIRYYDINGNISPNVFYITHEIENIQCTNDELIVDCLIDSRTLEFLKNFGVVYRDVFPVGNAGLVFGWNKTTSGTGSVTRSASGRFGLVNVKTTNTSSAAYISRNIIIPKKYFEGSSKHQPFNLWIHCEQSTPGNPMLKAYAAFKDLAGVVADRSLLAWTNLDAPKQIAIGIAGESYATRIQDFYANISVGINTGVTTEQNISLIMLASLPSFMSGLVTDLPYAIRSGNEDSGKEGLIVDFSITDEETVKRYVYRGCTATVVEDCGMVQDSRAKISFAARSSSFGEEA